MKINNNTIRFPQQLKNRCTAYNRFIKIMYFYHHMTMVDSLVKHKILKKDLQLNALLEITQAINSNLPESALYKIFNFTLCSNLHITRIALFVAEKNWSCRACFGTKYDFSKTKLPDRYKQLKTIHYLEDSRDELFCEFDLLIPFIHQQQTLALVFIRRDQGKSFDAENIKFIQTLCNITLVAIENKKLTTQQLEQEAFRKELEIASQVQHLLFPKKLPETNALKIEASYLPHDLVGGDYYDYIPLTQNRFFMCVADVSGKGIAAALMMSNFQATLHALIRQTTDLEEIVKVLNHRVLETTMGERIITFFGILYDHNLKTMQYVNAGHPPPLLYVGKKPVQMLNKGCAALGAIHPLPFVEVEIFPKLDDFFLFAYTDGLTETMNEKEELFEQHAVLEYLYNNHDKPLKAIHQDVIIMLDLFKGKNSYLDDITLLSCRVLNARS